MTHSHSNEVAHKTMGLIVGLTLIVVVAELIVGHFSNSLAVISDAGHNFADVLAIASSWYAIWVSTKAANSKKTFGYHRVGILAAFINALALVIMSLLIWWEAYERFKTPVIINGKVMIIMASVSLLMNAFNSCLLYKASKNNINIKSAFLHAFGDALTAFGVIIAGITVILTGKSIIDPLVSFFVGAFILWSSIGILRESINILMEATPHNLDMQLLEKEITSTPGVLGFHDLHVWTIASNIVACSCHIMVAEQTIRSGQQVLQVLAEELEHKFNITHTTIQIEVKGCAKNQIYCEIHKSNNHDNEHHH